MDFVDDDVLAVCEFLSMSFAFVLQNGRIPVFWLDWPRPDGWPVTWSLWEHHRRQSSELDLPQQLFGSTPDLRYDSGCSWSDGWGFTTRIISSSRPITGSISPRRAISVILIPYLSRVLQLEVFEVATVLRSINHCFSISPIRIELRDVIRRRFEIVQIHCKSRRMGQSHDCLSQSFL